ncbi:MAG: NAD(P)H-dependent oxidoreductase [Bdellovibrionaceae bacterium]|nr:NAD(P)H-dependent oxidoreductase [Pseudobdellovibrionaceae bacterium]
MKILLFAGSLRKDSLNKKLLACVARSLHSQHQTKVLDLQVLNIPVYDGDIETEHGIPQGVLRVAEALSEAHAVIIATPEYNGSISSPLKNILDWTSRIRPTHPWGKKPVLLLGASTGVFSAMRGLTHSRTPILNLGAYLYPNVFGLGQADKAFDSQDQLIDENTESRLQNLINEFVSYAQRLT